MLYLPEHYRIRNPNCLIVRTGRRSSAKMVARARLFWLEGLKA